MRFQSTSRAATVAFAAKIAERLLGTPTTRRATVLALRGDLGAGKTTFTQGLLKALGVRQSVTSPTFILMHRYALRGDRFTNAYHIDGYRLHDPKQFASLQLDDILADPHALVIVEWPERAAGILPRHTKLIAFSHGAHEGERVLSTRIL